jgi:hypothetical protein
MGKSRHDVTRTVARNTICCRYQMDFPHLLTQAIIRETLQLKDGVEILGISNPFKQIVGWETAGYNAPAR